MQPLLEPRPSGPHRDAPWPSLPSAEFGLAIALTDRNRPVRVFVGDGVGVQAFNYFCHGWAFSTYLRFGYSPGGDAVPLILQDEWREVPSPVAGGVVVWFFSDAGRAGIASHSAKIEAPNSDIEATILSSKNGANPLNINTSLRDVNRRYGGRPSGSLRFYTPLSGPRSTGISS